MFQLRSRSRVVLSDMEKWQDPWGGCGGGLCFSLINTTSELESQFAPIIINIHLGHSARVRYRTDEPDIWFKGILMSGMYKAQGRLK